MVPVSKRRWHQKSDQSMPIETAIQNGLSDKSSIDRKPVYRALVPRSEAAYDAMLKEWDGYLSKYPNSDPREIVDIKHFAEAVARSTKYRVDGIKQTATVDTVRNKMRKFMSAWKRKTDLVIPRDLHDTVYAYITNELRFTIPLSVEKRPRTFLTIDNYVCMHELLWQNDYHKYVHEGVRIHLAALLNMHCYSAARLQEICKATYKDLVCMVGWKDGEPEIKISFTREFAKGMQDNPKKPKHPLYERLSPTPPLFASSILFLLSIFISASAFRDFKEVQDVLDARPKANERYWIMDWEEGILEDPVFPEIRMSGPLKKSKNPTSWGKQCSDWATRAGFTTGMGLHAARREALIKVDDGGYSLGQVMKYAGHRNPKTLVGHYLDDMTNVDGAAAFLDLEQRRDVNKDFRSASMRWNPDLEHSLPAELSYNLENREDYVTLSKKIDDHSSQIKTAVSENKLKELKAQQDGFYYQRRRLREQELKRYQSSQQRVYKTQDNVLSGRDWRREYFDRVIRHMVPERARLGRILSLAVPLRSPQSISALEDLILLLKNDSNVAYQNVLRPINGNCAAPSCSTSMENISIEQRWNHSYHCCKADLEQNYGFARFYFLHSEWITNETDWEAHCRTHINDMKIPFRCDPVTFRHGLACAGYCPRCLGNSLLPAAERMRSYEHLSPWNRHLSHCIPEYIKSLPSQNSLPCPYPGCVAVLDSEPSLWYHLGDYHGSHKPSFGTKRPNKSKDSDDKGTKTLGAGWKRRRLHSNTQDGTPTASASQEVAIDQHAKGSEGNKFIPYFHKIQNPKPTIVVGMAESSVLFTPSHSSVCDESYQESRGGCFSTSTAFDSLTDCELSDYRAEKLLLQSEGAEHGCLEPNNIAPGSQPEDQRLPSNTTSLPPKIGPTEIPTEMIDPMLLLPVNSSNNIPEPISITHQGQLQNMAIRESQPSMEQEANKHNCNERVSIEPQHYEKTLICPKTKTMAQTQIDESDEYEVEQIFASRIYRKKLQYRVKWLVYADDPEWYNASNFKNSPHKLRDFHIANPSKPGPSMRQNLWIQCWEGDRDVSEHPDDNRPEGLHRRYKTSRG